MPEMTSYAHGMPCWADLATPDTDAAKAFYGELLGWESSDNLAGHDADGNPIYYTMFHPAGDEDRPVAAMMKLSEDMAEQGMPPTWSSYVSVEDIEAAVEAAKEAGGQVVMGPMDVKPVDSPTVGRMAALMDPAGAYINAWEPHDHIGASVMYEPGSLCWFELSLPQGGGEVADVAPFYSAVFGWEANDGMEQVENADGTYTNYTIFMADEAMAAGGMVVPVPKDEMPPHWAAYVMVENCDASHGKAIEMGATSLVPPTDLPSDGRFAVLMDPQGAVFWITGG